MKRQRPHTHPCEDCQTPVDCTGTWVRNYDGCPEAICEDYHLDNGQTALVCCEGCWTARAGLVVMDREGRR